MKSVYDTAHVFGRVIKNSVWRVRRYFNVTLALLSDQSGSHISPTSHLFRILSASNAPGCFFSDILARERNAFRTLISRIKYLRFNKSLAKLSFEKDFHHQKSENS